MSDDGADRTRLDRREKMAIRVLVHPGVGQARKQRTKDALAAHGVDRALYVIRVAQRFERRYLR